MQEEFSFKNFFSPLTTIKALHIIVIVGLIVFANTLFNEFVWDDLVLFFSNSHYQSISNIGYIFLDHSMPFYRPIHLAVLATLYTLFADTTFWYHLLEITLHIINACLLFILFKKFIPRFIALFLSLLFLVHPIQVESVSYISSMLNPLFLLLGLSAMFLATNEKIAKKFKCPLITILLLLCVLTKEAGFLFMIFIPFYLLLTKKNKKDYIFFLYSCISVLIPYLFLRFFITNVVKIENTYSPIPIHNASFYERFISLPKILSFYIETTFFPYQLAISQHWIVKEVTFQNFFFPLITVILFFVLLLGGAFYLYKKKSKNVLAYLFFLVWFLLSWGMHWNIILPLDMTVADRWFYMPLIGLLGMIGLLIAEIKIKKELLISVFILLITILSIRTMVRNVDWKNPLTLYQHDVATSTESYDLEMQLAEVLINNNRPKEAKPHIDKALSLTPEFYATWNVLGL